MSTIVYRYGLGLPRRGADRVREQMLAAHRAGNQLIEHARAARAAIADLEREHDAELSAIHEEVAALEEERDAARKANDREAARALVPRLRELLQREREVRRDLREREDFRAARAEIYERERERKLALYAEVVSAGPLYWPTWNLVAASVDAAKKGGDLRFRRWSGEGQIGCQLQQPRPTEAIMSGDSTILQIDPPSGAQGRQVAGSRRAGTRTTLRMRIGSHPDRSPEWAEWPMVLHRPMPEGAIVRAATVNCRLLADRERWSVQITLEVPEVERRTGRRILGVNFGWRQEGDDVRVAATSDGEILHVPSSTRWRLGHADDMRSIRDQDLDEMRSELWSLLRPLTRGESDLGRAVEHLHQWRSPSRFRRLLQRDDLPEPARQILEPWHHRDRHLWQYEAGERAGAVLHRRDCYRAWAAKVLEGVDVLAMDDVSLTQLKEIAPTTGIRRTRDGAAPGELRSALLNRARSQGIGIVMVDPAQTSRTCDCCGNVNAAWNTAASIEQVCEGCGVVHDQDLLAARNIAQRAVGAAGAAPTERRAKFAARHRSKDAV